MSRISNFFVDFFGKNNTIELNDLAYSKPMAEMHYLRLAIGVASSIISDTISKCETKFYYDGENDNKSLEYYRWNIAPNANQNGSEFKSLIVENIIKNGDCLVIENKNELFVAENFTVEKEGTKPYLFTNVTIDGVSMPKAYKRKDVLYFKLNEIDLTAILKRVYNSYGEILATAIDSYKASNSSKWKLKVSANAKASKNFKETYQELTQKSLKTFFENPNAVYPEFEGYELVNVSKGTAAQGGAEVSDLRKDIFELVAQTYKIPQPLMNGEAVTDDIVLNFITICIEPIVQMMSAEVTKQYFDYDAWAGGNHCEFDTTAISISAIASIAQACEKFIGSGCMNIDETRERILGLNALNTDLSQKYFVTKNFADIESEGERGEEN